MCSVRGSNDEDDCNDDGAGGDGQCGECAASPVVRDSGEHGGDDGLPAHLGHVSAARPERQRDLRGDAEGVDILHEVPCRLPLYVLEDEQVVRWLGSWWDWHWTMQGHPSLLLARSYVNGVRVSTIFEGMGAYAPWLGEPQCFESMVFTDKGHGVGGQVRYSTYAEAMEGHMELCREWKGGAA